MLAFLSSPATAFTRAGGHATLTPTRRPTPTRVSRRACPLRASSSHTNPPPPTPEPELDPSSADLDMAAAMAAITTFLATASAAPGAASAADLAEVFKTKPASLAHPATMWLMFAGAAYTFYLGYQASQVRKVDADARKELIKGKFGAKHFQTSASIMAIMTVTTFEGMANTYTRTGKLFPGPHLYVGLGLVALMSVMASLAPAMQKGEGWARDVHFTLAFFALGMFAWQAQSGMVIVGKLLGWA